MNILVLGGEAGSVELYAYGMYKIATLTEVRFFYSFNIRKLLRSLIGVYFVYLANIHSVPARRSILLMSLLSVFKFVSESVFFIDEIIHPFRFSSKTKHHMSNEI